MLIDSFYRELKYRTLFHSLTEKASEEKDLMSVVLLKTEMIRINKIKEDLNRLREYRKFIANYNDHNGNWFKGNS